MKCDNCGAPIEAEDIDCAFCGIEVSLEKDGIAAVPTAHQRGEVLELSKTRQDSLREIAKGMEVAVEGDKRSRTLHRFVPKLVVAVIILALVAGIASVISTAQYESVLNEAIMAIPIGDFGRSRERLDLASDMSGAVEGEPEFFRGLGFFVEGYRKKDQQKELYRQAESAFRASARANPDRPHANLYLAALALRDARSTEAKEYLDLCLKSGGDETYLTVAKELSRPEHFKEPPIFYSKIQTGFNVTPNFPKPANGFELPSSR